MWEIGLYNYLDNKNIKMSQENTVIVKAIKKQLDTNRTTLKMPQTPE